MRHAFERYKWVKPRNGYHYAEFDHLNEAGVFPMLEQVRAKPFFLYIHTLDTHTPHYVHNKYDDWVDYNLSQYNVVYESSGNERRRVSLRDEEGKQHLLGAYDGSIRFADYHLGRLVQKLKEMDLWENTILIVNSDHGEVLGEDGSRECAGTVGHPYEVTAQELVYVPLIATGPGIPRGLRVSEMTENVDIVPSLLDILGVKSDAYYDGVSFVPLLEGGRRREEKKYALFKAALAHRSEDTLPIFAVHDGRFTFEHNPHDGVEHLWLMPDHFAARTDVLHSNPDEVTTRRAYIAERLMPRWQAYEGLGRTMPDSEDPFIETLREALLLGRIAPRDAVVETSACSGDDGKWQFSGSYLEYGCDEQVEPLHITVHIPNGDYDVKLGYAIGLKDDRAGSTFLAEAPGMPEMTAMNKSSENPEAAASRLVWDDLCQSKVVDGTFTLKLQGLQKGTWASVYGVKFQRIEKVQESVVGSSEGLREDVAEDQLRALGYL